MSSVSALGQEPEAVPAFVEARYLRAARAGDAKAQFSLGLLHERGLIRRTGGDSADHSRDQAVHWYGIAAGNGYAPAQFRLAVLFQNGDGQQQERAFELYGQAAEQGLPEAQYNLALMMDRRGSPEDAIPWLEKAASRDMGQAMRQLGLMYAEGRGVAQDIIQAWIWLVRAVGAGDNDSIVLVSELDALLTDEQRDFAKKKLNSEAFPVSGSDE